MWRIALGAAIITSLIISVVTVLVVWIIMRLA